LPTILGELSAIRRSQVLANDVASDRQALARFQREAQAASSLNHPNICTIHDIGEDDGHAFIAMEFLDGVTLKHRIAGHPLEMETLLTLAIDIADALEAAHTAGIVHRDTSSGCVELFSTGHLRHPVNPHNDAANIKTMCHSRCKG
jgi:serine/threonine protein kinase